MASVALTQTRKDQIKKHIEQMAEADLRLEVPGYEEESSIDASDYLTKLQFYPHVEIARTIPRQWLAPMPESYREVVVLPRYPTVTKDRYGNNNEETVVPTLVVSFPQSADGYHRPDRHSYRHPGTIISEADLRALGAEYFCPAHTHMLRCLDLLPQVQANREKWKTIQTQLMSLLDQATTVNMALRAFPELKLYLPQDIIDAVNKRVEKGERKEVSTTGLDLDVLTMTGVASVLSRRNESEGA